MTTSSRWAMKLSVMALAVSVMAIFWVWAVKTTPCAGAQATCPIALTRVISQGLTINDDAADSDSRLEGDTNANLQYWDAGADSIGLGAVVTAGAFETVTGYTTNRAGVTSVGRELHAPAGTFTQTNAAITTLAIGGRWFIGAPTFAGSNATQVYTDMATFWVDAPVAGTNMAFTRAYTMGLAAGTTGTLWLSRDTDSTTAAGGLLFGSSRDTNLYRSAANTLRTDDSFTSLALLATANDSGAIGASGTAFSDLYLASGAVVDFAAGDVTLTHAANQLQIAGGDYVVTDGNGLIVGNTAQVALGSVLSELEVLGTVNADTSVSIARFSADNVGPRLRVAKSRNASIGSYTIVQADDDLGTIAWGLDNGTALTSDAASIAVYVDGTPGAADSPARMVFSVTPDGSITPAESFRISNDANIYVANNNGVVIGNAAQLSFPAVSELQVLGTAQGDSQIGIARFGGAGAGPSLWFATSRNATIGSFTIVSDNDAVGTLEFHADDGTDYATVVGRIEVEVDDATPAASDIGGTVVVYTAPGGGSIDGIREVARWAATGDYTQTVGNMIALAGMRIGADAAANEIDDASQGGSNTTLYIGNASINVTVSDARLKNVVGPSAVNALSEINRLPLVDYTWNANAENLAARSAQPWIGMVAQDLYALPDFMKYVVRPAGTDNRASLATDAAILRAAVAPLVADAEAAETVAKAAESESAATEKSAEELGKDADAAEKMASALDPKDTSAPSTTRRNDATSKRSAALTARFNADQKKAASETARTQAETKRAAADDARRKAHDAQEKVATADSYWSIDYQYMVPLAFKGIQELYAEVDTLKARLAVLEAKVP